MKKDLILVISDSMDNNGKSDRYEDKLIRIGESARANLGLSNDKTVELWPDGNTSERISRSRILKIFKAYSSDLKNLKRSGMSRDELLRVGFVTHKTFKYICKDTRDDRKNIWVSDTIEDTVLGADPEFVLMENGEMLYAASVPGFGYTGELAADGPWAEVRPRPTIKVDHLVNNIQKIFKENPAREYIMSYDWVGGCKFKLRQDGRNCPVGGHIHIGMPALLYDAAEYSISTGRNSNSSCRYINLIYGCLAKAIDEYITIPMMKVDGIQESISRRERYGQYGDIRLDHGGRIEHRTLSGKWLVHPDLAKAVIGSTKAVTKSLFKILEDDKFDKSCIASDNITPFLDGSKMNVYPLFKNDFNGWKNVKLMKDLRATRPSRQMQNILENGHISFNKNYYDVLKSMFKELPMYKKHSKYVDKFVEIVSLPSNQLKKIDNNLKENWLNGKKFII